MNGSGYFYPAMSLKLMNYLASRGFEVMKVRDAKYDPSIKVFYFVRTPELEEAVKEYLRKEGKPID